MFKHNTSEYNVPFFMADSEIEGKFLMFCHASKLIPHKKTILEYDEDGTESDNYLYLCLKDDDGRCILENGQEFINNSAACPGGGKFGDCGSGAVQAEKVSVNSQGVQEVTAQGLLTCRYPSVPRIFLTSSRVGEALKKAGATGCEIVPTDNPNCLQFRITTETAGPAQIGQARMGQRCPICGTAKMFLGNSERFFYPGDLKPTDFQICRLYEATNVGRFKILNGFPIVSKRIFNLLLDLKIKGLARYSSDPPVQHAVVQIKK